VGVRWVAEPELGSVAAVFTEAWQGKADEADEIGVIADDRCSRVVTSVTTNKFDKTPGRKIKPEPPSDQASEVTFDVCRCPELQSLEQVRSKDHTDRATRVRN
jgi:hypothetical protein